MSAPPRVCLRLNAIRSLHHSHSSLSPVMNLGDGAVLTFPAWPAGGRNEMERSEISNVIGVRPTECDGIDPSISPNKLV